MGTGTETYYIARGRSLDAIKAFQSSRAAYLAACNELIAKHGGPWPGLVPGFRDGRMVAWIAEGVVDTVPECLRLYKGGGHYVPNGKTPTGRSLSAGLRVVNESCPSAYKLTMAMCGDVSISTTNGEMRMISYGFEKLGDDYVISGNDGGLVPYDAEPIARSVYWAKKEAMSPSV